MGNDSFQQQIFGMIQSLSGEKNLLAIPREIIRFTGDLESGVFLAQLIYWTDKGSRKDGFIYKTLKEWQDEIFISEYSLRKIRKRLESMGILETKVKKANGNPTLHYRINQKAFVNRFLCFQSKETSISKKEDCVSEDSITYTTPKTTNINYKNENGATSGDDRTSLSFSLEEITVAKTAINYYFKVYEKYMGADHPKLKKKQIDTVIKNICYAANNYGLDQGNLEDMIERHFKRNIDTDYNINHFATEGILSNLMYEVAY